MATSTSTGAALKSLLIEGLKGASPGNAWFLNPGDPGLLTLCRSLSAEEASRSPGPNRQTIAAHARHVVYHLELIDRTLNGDETAFQTADWSEAWKHPQVSDVEWSELLKRLESLADRWIEACAFVPLDEKVMLTGSLASSAHFAYHLSAIRQILLDIRQN